ncbi:Hypothetical protein D9617_43g040400 [Elsinoe fawcettii]|nr:Hypothetical protein D9617_43g040400 [Elsinoe fawcettii]
METVEKANDQHWRIPPQVKVTPADLGYKWDVRPDCSYWLSCAIINETYRATISNITHIHANICMTPYLTVEFKRDSTDTIVPARHQVAIAASMAVYNRWRLKDKHMTLARQSWSSEQIDMVRHYGMTFHLQQCEVWRMDPVMSDDKSWAGCRMSLLATLNCDDIAGLRNGAEWINEIHWWGLTVHGPDCENDIKRITDR